MKSNSFTYFLKQIRNFTKTFMFLFFVVYFIYSEQITFIDYVYNMFCLYVLAIALLTCIYFVLEYRFK